MLFWKGAGEAGRGRVKSSRQTLQQARAEMLSGGAKDFAGAMFALEAFNDARFGYPAEAREKAGEAIAMSHDWDVRAFAAEALALAGDGAKPAAIMTDLNHEFPENWYLHVISTAQVQAVEDLQKNKPGDALTALEALRPYELGTGPHAVGFDANFFRGQAYLKLHDGVKAAAEFQRILDHHGTSAWDPGFSLARLNLARAYVLQGDTAKARTAYQDFFAAWKDADADLPALIEAHAEYEKLK
jgi:Flp pilus assembly protein TadD